MRKAYLTIILLVLATVSASGQDRNSLLQRINEIKSQNETYFWDQYTHPDADTAKVNATKRLLLDVNNNIGSKRLSVEEIMPHATYIAIDRGRLKQFFVYIRKSETLALANGNQALDSKVLDTPVYAGAPADAREAARPVQKAFVPDAFVQRIVETKNFLNVYKLLTLLQAEGQVLQFGKLKDVADYSSLDLILFDIQSQEVITLLSPVTQSGGRTNMVNGAEDALENYPTNMTAVIWYIKKM